MKNKKKILIFTGAGVSAESGIATFRTGGNGLWNNYKVEDIATPMAWKKNKKLVLDFYNQRKSELKTVEPNISHKIIADLEKYFDVMLVTQNVDNLHERAGSTNIIHLHGELTKSRSTIDSDLVYDCDGDINIGDKCEKGSQLRPHIVWFYEGLNPDNLQNANDAAYEADVCIVVGTSMQVAPANQIPFQTKECSLIYYVDPSEVDFYVPSFRRPFFYHIKENASTGMQKVYDDLIKIFGQRDI